MISEENWCNLWAEWQVKRHKLRVSLELPVEKCDNYIDDLDEAHINFTIEYITLNTVE